MHQISNYQIVEPLGSGGMAQVYRAHDPSFDREVAIKVVAAQYLNDANFHKRFEREAKVIASLQHPNIVPVYEYGHENGMPYLVMALMQGGSLAKQLESHSFPVSEIVPLIDHLTLALDLAHTQGIVHRDLKPDNILFDQYNNPYIADFGIAKLLAESTKLSQTGNAIGTPYYMSPEQARGQADIDGRSDIYALGIILFELFTGERPFNADTAAGLIYKHIHEPAPKLCAFNPHIPAVFEEVITTALAKEREDRFQTGQEMAADLKTAAVPSLAVVNGTAKSTLVEKTPSQQIPAATLNPSEEMPSSDLQIRPWVRYFARLIDIYSFAFVIGFISTFIYEPLFYIEPAILLDFSLALIFVFVEPLMLMLWGTTPGKYLLNITLRKTNGYPLNYKEALNRSFQVWLRGMGLSIPFIATIAQFTAYRTLTNDGITTWDREGDYSVSHGTIGVTRSILVGLLIVIYIAMMVIGSGEV